MDINKECNENVLCCNPPSFCERCGWNTVEKFRRVEKIRKELLGEVPKSENRD